ncbi:MAG: Blp family class II bacteriocin [Lunatimonas sp.]|uniref:Blp family class II bacteriocin n=1 Tax=Lunatimonas sp. TaxID=2060141 RepID=UPI00263B5CFA|nr:Blp family class II bacteriocin [Lunatimonas sp.]MCC5935799.1 Blp family class II bacteriocin [Lunatimonas sp.]
MKELSLERMENITGGSVNVPACGFAIVSAVAVGVMIAMTPATGGSIWAVAGYMFGGFASGSSLGAGIYECVSSF